MSDSRRKLLGDLALLSKDDDDRKPTTERARQALSDAHETQERIDAMGEDTGEEETAEDDRELYEDELEELEVLRASNKELRSANIRLNAKLVAAGVDAQALEKLVTKLTIQMGELEDNVATLQAKYTALLESSGKAL